MFYIIKIHLKLIHFTNVLFSCLTVTFGVVLCKKRVFFAILCFQFELKKWFFVLVFNQFG